MNGIKGIIKFIAVPLFECLSWLSKKFAALTHRLLFYSEWFYDAPYNFDHQIDLYYQWGKNRNPFWLERGIYNVLALQVFDHPNVVELSCGDGFNAYFFYSYYADKVFACDIDKTAIRKARRKYKKGRIMYEVLDIRRNLKETIAKQGRVTNVIWDTAMAYFTPNEIHGIIKEIKDALKDSKGILSGHTIQASGGGGFYQHKYEFKDMEDLRSFFTPYFKNVIVFETKSKTGIHNYYFYASDGEIPFSEDWKHWLK